MESTGLTKKQLMIIASTILICIGGYYWHKNWSLRRHYVMEYWLSYKHTSDPDKFNCELKKIESDMRMDGYNALEIYQIRHEGIDHALPKN